MKRKSSAVIIEKLKSILPEIRDKYSIKSIGVFGSYVRGDYKKNSDVDILVEFNGSMTLFQFIDLEDKLSERLGKKVDLVMKSALKPHIGKYILSEVIYI